MSEFILLQIEAIRKILQTLNWDIEKRGEDLYISYAGTKLEKVSKFMERSGKLYQANDHTFALFMGAKGFALTLKRIIHGEVVTLHVNPKVDEHHEMMLQFYCQHPQSNTDCICRVSHSKMKMIETKGDKTIKCGVVCHHLETDADASLIIRNYDKTFTVLSDHSFPGKIYYSLEQEGYRRPPRTIIKESGTCSDISRQETAYNILGLSAASQTCQELFQLFQEFIPEFPTYLQENFPSSSKYFLEQPIKSRRLIEKLKMTSFYKFAAPRL